MPAAAEEVAAVTIDPSTLERLKVELVKSPFVHSHDQVATGGPKIIEFTMVIEEKVHEVDDEGTTIWAMSFNGSTSRPLMVVHEGDYVELTLINLDTNLMAHSIDFHAATGAQLTEVNPSDKAVLRFKAAKTGAIMVLPRDGLSDGKGQRLGL